VWARLDDNLSRRLGRHEALQAPQGTSIGNIPHAIAAYERAAACAPMDAMIQNNLAWLYAIAGNNEAAALLWLELPPLSPARLCIT